MHQVMIAYIVTNANYLLVLMKEINTVVDMNYAISFLLDSIFSVLALLIFVQWERIVLLLLLICFHVVMNLADLFSYGNESQFMVKTENACLSNQT